MRKLELRDPEQCPACKGDSKVMDSRRQPTHRWRRRKCLECGELWYTYESLINPESIRLRAAQPDA